MTCIAEVHERLHEYNTSQHDIDKEVMMCMGVEHGEILVMGEDLFGWTWDVTYKLGEEMADGKTHEILLGPKIHELAVPKWTAPAGVTFESRDVQILGVDMKAQRMLTASDQETAAPEAEAAAAKAEEEKKKAEEEAAAAKKAEEEKKKQEEEAAAAKKAEEEKKKKEDEDKAAAAKKAE